MKPLLIALAICLFVTASCKKQRDDVPHATAPAPVAINGTFRCTVKDFKKFTGERGYYDSTLGYAVVKWETDSSTVWSNDTLTISGAADSALSANWLLPNNGKLKTPNHYAGWDAYTYSSYGWDVYYYPDKDSVYIKEYLSQGPGNDHNDYITEHFGTRIK